MKEQDYITLKWGTLKSWCLKNSPKAFKALKKYSKLGISFSAMAQEDTPEQKKLICTMIDEVNADTIYLEWDGKDVSKEEAKKYVMEYGKN